MDTTEKRPDAETLAMNTSPNPLDGNRVTAQSKATSQDTIIISRAKNRPRHLSTLISRNVIISGRRTSVRLEPAMWDGLQEVCQREHSSVHQICNSVSLQKPDDATLTSSIRVFIMRYYRDAATEEGHQKTGHGFGVAAFDAGRNGAVHHDKPSLVAFTKTSFA